MTIPTDHETNILARVLGNDEKELSAEFARYLLSRDFSQRDRTRMHELAVRNQSDELSADEKAEMFAYARAGTILSILQIKARRTLKGKPKKRA
jgi:hypothetical protein